MPSETFTTLLGAALPLFCGIWATLVGFEYIGKPAGAELNPNYRIRQRVYRTGGPAMIGLALLLIGKVSFESLAPLQWQRYAPPDAGFAIDLPGKPVESVVEEPGEYGPPKSHIARVHVRNLNLVCSVRRTPWPEKFPDLSREQKKERLKNAQDLIVESSEGKLLDDESFNEPAGPGRKFRIEMPRGAIARFMILSLGRTDFHLMLVAPASLARSSIADRFSESFTFLEATGQNKNVD